MKKRRASSALDQELRTSLFLGNTVRSRPGDAIEKAETKAVTNGLKFFGKAAQRVQAYRADCFDSNAKVAIDLLAMRPSRSDVEKFLKEYDPPIVPCGT
jgi:hypothetical protein